MKTSCICVCHFILKIVFFFYIDVKTNSQTHLFFLKLADNLMTTQRCSVLHQHFLYIQTTASEAIGKMY